MLKDEVRRRVMSVLVRGDYNIKDVVMDIIEKSFDDLPDGPTITGEVRAVLDDALRMAKTEEGIRSAGYRLRRLVRAVEGVVKLPLSPDESLERACAAEAKVALLQGELAAEHKWRAELERDVAPPIDFEEV
jgi:hypothetical protein